MYGGNGFNNNRGWSNPWANNSGSAAFQQQQGNDRQPQQQPFQQQQSYGNVQGNQMAAQQLQFQAQQSVNTSNIMAFQQGIMPHAMGNMGVIIAGSGGGQIPLINTNLNQAALIGMNQSNNNISTASVFGQNQQILQHGIYQINSGFPRHQPPLPPGPPPKDQPTRSLLNPLFNNAVVINPAPPPPLPANETKSVPPPPPPAETKPKVENDILKSRQNQELKIPDQILRLLQNSETALQLQQAAEVLGQITPHMALNVSQELFGTTKKSDGGIPGLDLAVTESRQSSPEIVEIEQDPMPGLKTNLDMDKSKNVGRTGDRKLDLKQPEHWNEGRKDRWKMKIGTSASLEKEKVGNNSKSEEIKWELRSEAFEKSMSNSKSSTKSTIPSDVLQEDKNEKSKINTRNSASSFQLETQSNSSLQGQLSNSKISSANNDEESIDSENDDYLNNSFSASIPLGSSDGQPIVYDRKSLKAFDKKFREWEKQFDDWKTSNQNHPDKDRYKKYMDQWNLWRHQLVEQRRFIIDCINKARMEAQELLIQKSLENMPDSNKISPLSSSTSRNDNTSQNTPAETAVVSPKIGNNWQGQINKHQDAPNKNPREPRPPSLMSMNITKPASTPSEKIEVSGSSQSSQIEVERRQTFPSSNQNSTSQIQNNCQSQEKRSAPLFPSASTSDLNSGAFNYKDQTSNFKQDNVKQISIPQTSISTRNERPVERIPRDRDRATLLPNQPNVNVNNKDTKQKPATNLSERVPRDRPALIETAPFSVNDVSWELPNRNPAPNPFETNRNDTINPFEAAHRQQNQNPFVEASNKQKSYNSWSTVDENLPTLSAFLKKDEFSVSPQMLSHRSLTDNNIVSNSNRFPDQRYSQQQMSVNQTVSFEPTSKALPLVVASKPKITERSAAVATNQNQDSGGGSNDNLTHWYTRDRASRTETFEDDYGNKDYSTLNEQYDPPVAVIDYGHGSVPKMDEHDEYDEYDLPRGERPMENYNDDDFKDDYDDDENKSVVTFDYGHGSVPPRDFSKVGPSQTSTSHDHYYNEDSSHDESRGHEDNFYSQSRFQAQRGRGLAFHGNRESVEYASDRYAEQQRQNHPESFGRGRGRGIGIVPAPVPRSREIIMPQANTGKGRGMPSRFGAVSVEDSEFVGRSISKLSNTEVDSELNTERVNSPEIVTRISSPQSPRRRMARERPRNSRSDRIERDPHSSLGREPYRDSNSSHGNRNWSDNNDARFRAPILDTIELEGAGDLNRPIITYDWEEQEQEKEMENKTVKRSPKFQRERNYENSSMSIRRDQERNEKHRSPPRRDRENMYSSSVRRDRERELSPRRDRERGRVRIDREKGRPTDGGIHRSRHGSRSRSPTFRGSRPSFSDGKDMNFPGSNPAPPRYQTVLIEDILNQPGRLKRPTQILIILRGLPGSGKSYVAKLIKDREVEMGGSAPKILSLDDYFMQETEKLVKDPLTRSEVKETVMVYEYEADHEPKYRNDLLKTLKKNVETGYYPFFIIDCVNDQVKYFEEMVNFAIQRRFQVYIADVEETIENCLKRNIHNRTKDQIMKIHRNWERTPSNFIKLDIRTLLQDEAIQDVEMEDVSDTEVPVEVGSKLKMSKKSEDKVSTKWEDEEGTEENIFPETSKWEKMEPSEEKLNRLDGLARKRSAKDDEDKADSSLSSSIESWLQSHLPEDYISRQTTRPGQKRVRWADIEEKRAQERMRDVGFVVGHTDWNRMTDPTFGATALTRTKFF